MSGVALVPGKSQLSDSNGNPLAAGTVDVYLAGTTTRTNSWQDQALTTLNTNPIALDASGSCSMWLDGSTLYKIVVKNAAGAVQSHLGGDNISGVSGSGSLVSFQQSGTSMASRTAQAKMRERLSTDDQSIAADGVTNDSEKIKNLLAEGTSRSGVTLNLTAKASGYGIDRPYTGSQRGLPVPANVSLKGDNTKLVLLGNSEFIYLGRPQDRDDTTFVSFYGITAGVDYAQITADTATTDTAITVNAGDEAAFAAGDLVYVRLGQAAYDSAEPDWFYFAKVVSTASGTVTLDRPTGYALDVDASTTGDTTSGNSTVANVAGIANVKPWMTVTGTGIPANTFVGTVLSTSFTLVNAAGTLVNATATNAGVSLTIQTVVRQRRIIKVNDIPQNQTIEGLYLQGATSGTANAEFGIHMRYARNITFRNIGGRDVGPGLIGGQFAENILIENVSLDQCAARTQSSKGRMFSFAEMKGVTVQNYRAEKFDHVMAFIEGGSEDVRFFDGVVVNNASGRASTDQIFFLAGAKDCLIDGLRLEGNPCTILQTSNDTNLRPPFLRNVIASPSFTPTFGTVARWFDVDHVAENVKMGTWFHFKTKKRFTLELTLQASQAFKQIGLPFGVYTRIIFTITNKTGITGMGLAHTAGANPVPSTGVAVLPAALTNNTPFEFPKTSPYPWWLVGSSHPFVTPSTQKYIYYQSDGTVVAGSKVYVELEYFPAATPTILQDTLTYWATT